MSQSNQYFIIPFANVPNNPTYTVWFASWSTVRPTLEPGMQPPLVVGVIAGQLPSGATLLASSGKDPPPPPPPLAVVDPSDYQKSVTAWLDLSRDA